MVSVTAFSLLVLVASTQATNCTTESKSCRNVIYHVENLSQGKSETEVLGTFLSNVVDKVYRLENEVETLRESQADLQRQINEVKAKTSQSIGFHVLLNQTHESAQSIIPFNKVISNYGNGWNNITHDFVAPKKGLYMFYLSFLNVYKILSWAEIRRGNTWVTRSYTHSDTFSVGSCSTVLELNQCEVVSAWLMLGKLHGNSWAHFVGTLIKS